MTDTGKGLARRYQVCKNTGQQRTKGNHIMPPASPHKKSNGYDGDCEQETLIISHTNISSDTNSTLPSTQITCTMLRIDRKKIEKIMESLAELRQSARKRKKKDQALMAAQALAISSSAISQREPSRTHSSLSCAGRKIAPVKDTAETK